MQMKVQIWQAKMGEAKNEPKHVTSNHSLLRSSKHPSFLSQTIIICCKPYFCHWGIADALQRPCCKTRCKRKLSVKLVLACCIAFWSLTKSGQDCLLLVKIRSETPLCGQGARAPLKLRLWSLQSSSTWQDESEEDSGSSSSSDESDSDGSSVHTKRRRKWHIEGLFCCCQPFHGGHDPLTLTGYEVCRAAFCQLLGIGRQRLARCKKTFRGQDYRKFGSLLKLHNGHRCSSIQHHT